MNKLSDCLSFKHMIVGIGIDSQFTRSIGLFSKNKVLKNCQINIVTFAITVGFDSQYVSVSPNQIHNVVD